MSGDVSRETDAAEAGQDSLREAPPAPEVARGVFPLERLALAERYAAWLADAGVVRGLIGPREVPRLWDRHVLNCAVLERLLPEGASVADVGSGAGLPGIVLAIARPDLRLTLIEPLLRRTVFLEEVSADLGLTNVEVVRGRADALHGVRSFDVVTSRAVAPLERLLRWSMPLVASDGAMVALKGSAAEAEVDPAGPVLTRLGCATPEIVRLGEGVLAEPTAAVRVAWADPSQVSLRLARAGAATASGESRKRRRNRGR